jgi:hexosaminidase
MLSKFVYYLTMAFLLTACHQNINNPVKNVNELGLIPQPQKISLQKYAFLYDANTPFVIDKKADDYLVEEVKNLFSTNQIYLHKDADASKTIRLVIDSNGFDNKEAYHLRVNPDEILINAEDSQGLFYGLQTLRQLFPENINPLADTIPALTITDTPQFAWRGLHLDVSRHFFDVTFIKKYIDLLAKHKMNTFHWHLVDDQGWRIEIKQYPKLTSVGSMRKETVVKKHFKPYIGDGKPYGGYYTQDEIKEVITYAQSKYVTVVPEIEMPGHSMAALAAYPQFSCTGGPFEVATKWGIFKDVYCAGNDSTFIFLENILDEVMSLFPSKYIHIGGDEVPKDRWVVCQKCQQRIKDEHLKDTHELQSYFIKRIEKYVNKKGRQIIGWDEILEGGLAPGASVMS